jgi:hypothetical protein
MPTGRPVECRPLAFGMALIVSTPAEDIHDRRGGAPQPRRKTTTPGWCPKRPLSAVAR